MCEEVGRGLGGAKQGSEGIREGREFIGQHSVGPAEGVDVYPGEGPPLGHCVSLPVREGQVEGSGLPVPEGPEFQGLEEGLGAHWKPGRVPLAWWVVGSAHREVQVVHPGGKSLAT